jgi:hypothetical protein
MPYGMEGPTKPAKETAISVFYFKKCARLCTLVSSATEPDVRLTLRSHNQLGISQSNEFLEPQPSRCICRAAKTEFQKNRLH